MALLKLELSTGKPLIVDPEEAKTGGIWEDDKDGAPITCVRVQGITHYVRESLADIEEMLDAGKRSEPVKSKQTKDDTKKLKA